MIIPVLCGAMLQLQSAMGVFQTAVLSHQGLALHGLALVQSRQPLVISQQLLVNATQIFTFPHGAVPLAFCPQLLLLELSILGHEGGALRVQSGLLHLEKEGIRG